MRRILGVLALYAPLLTACPPDEPPPIGDDAFVGCGDPDAPVPRFAPPTGPCAAGLVCSAAPGYETECRRPCDVVGAACPLQVPGDAVCTDLDGALVCAEGHCTGGDRFCLDAFSGDSGVCCPVEAACGVDDGEPFCAFPQPVGGRCAEALRTPSPCLDGATCVFDEINDSEAFCRLPCGPDVACPAEHTCREVLDGTTGSFCFPGVVRDASFACCGADGCSGAPAITCDDGLVCTGGDGRDTRCRRPCGFDDVGDPCPGQVEGDDVCTLLDSVDGGAVACAGVHCGAGTHACSDAICCDDGVDCALHDGEPFCALPRSLGSVCAQGATPRFPCADELLCVRVEGEPELAVCRAPCTDLGAACAEGTCQAPPGDVCENDGQCRAPLDGELFCLP